MTIRDEAEKSILADIAASLRLNSDLAQDPARAEQAKVMLGRLTRNEPLATSEENARDASTT